MTPQPGKYLSTHQPEFFSPTDPWRYLRSKNQQSRATLDKKHSIPRLGFL